MECVVCKFNCDQMMTCDCGNCKDCGVQISYSAYDYCNDCSTKLGRCYHCGMDLKNFNLNVCFTKLTNAKIEMLDEHNKLMELAEKHGLNKDNYEIEVTNINNTFNNYVELLKSGKTNFIDV